MAHNMGDNPPDRILVFIPNWVGDVVLASPTLAALRDRFRDTHITYLMRSYVADVLAGCGWHDAAEYWPDGGGVGREWRISRLIQHLRARNFDLALLLTNSFRTAWVARRVGARRRVGYARDWRGWLLTDRLAPLKRAGRFVPSSVLPYYAELAEHIGCPVTDRRLRLGISPEQEQAGQDLLRHYGLDGGRPYALINPGAAFGAAKCWPPERFAEVCERLESEQDMRAVLVGAPREAPLMHAIADRAHPAPVCRTDPGTTLGSLKVLAREAALLVCNDTGPRHYGIAFDVPTVTIFGPTHQEWTDTDYAGEIKLQVPVECGPCQLPKCPIDLRCMTGLTADMVMAAVSTVLATRKSVVVGQTVDERSADREPCAQEGQ